MVTGDGAVRADGVVDRRIERASAYLLAQSGSQFEETSHTMHFPHVAGFTGTSEQQSSDLFARATLAHLLLDIAECVPDAETAASFRVIARREADYIARAKVSNRTGGWSYFPDLPELPPDIDSLAAALSLFLRISPEHAALCEGPVQQALDGMNEDGSLETWIVSPQDAPTDRARMHWAIDHCWGKGTDPDVLAHFCHALWLWVPQRYAEVIRRGASKLIGLQQPNGAWQATWYAGPAYGTGQVLRLLRETGIDGGAAAAASGRAVRFLLDTQGEDGCWSKLRSASLQTALSMTALCFASPGAVDDGKITTALRVAAVALRSRQLADGSWQASPWIQMEIGRATGKVLQVATYKSTTLTTAFCLRALLYVA